MLAPGGIYLIIGFVVPADHHRDHVAVDRRPLLDGRPADVRLELVELHLRASRSTGPCTFARSMYAAIATILCIGLAYPMAYWIAFYGGKWKATLFMLILVPFFVSFVIRTVQWNFILGANGPAFHVLKSLGVVNEDFTDPQDANRRDRRHHVQLHAVCGVAAVRRARADRPTAGRGRQGLVLVEVGWRSARWSCRFRTRASLPRSSSRSCPRPAIT